MTFWDGNPQLHLLLWLKEWFNLNFIVTASSTSEVSQNGQRRESKEDTCDFWSGRVFGSAGLYKQQVQNFKKYNWKVIGVSKREHPFSSFIIDITYKNKLQNAKAKG